jgi:hypothetical protein
VDIGVQADSSHDLAGAHDGQIGAQQDHIREASAGLKQSVSAITRHDQDGATIETEASEVMVGSRLAVRDQHRQCPVVERSGHTA